MKASRIKIAVIEHNKGFRTNIVNEINSHPLVIWVNDYKSNEEFLVSKHIHQYDLLFLDINLTGMNGIDLLKIIKKYNSQLRTIIITSIIIESTIVKAFQNGAIGFLYKSDRISMTDVIDIFLKGDSIISPSIAFKMIQMIKTRDLVELPLTSREKQILELLVTGASCKKSAEILNISINTARKHVRNIYDKLQVKNRAEMLKKAYDYGLT